jgi:hypothetical protein
MLLSAVSVLVVVQPSSEILEGLMNYPVFCGVLFYFNSQEFNNKNLKVYKNTYRLT